MDELPGKRILLIIGGGIAAFKCLELIRRLRERGASVRCVMTRAAEHFVTPLSVASLAGDKVYQELFSLTDESEMGHIRLSREADLLVVAPATADLLAKMAHGFADDLASTVLLATDKPVLVAPAMNPDMWANRASERNMATLSGDGVLTVGPNPGEMACGEWGFGRLAEPQEILAAIERFFTAGERAAGEAGVGEAAGAEAKALADVEALVTSGPTHEPIDPVRYIANRSSGRQGHAIARALADAGATVTLVSGPVGIEPPPGVRHVPVTSALDMREACLAHLPRDVAVCAAAVADWRPERAPDAKIKKVAGEDAPVIRLVENPDILKTIATHARRPRLVVGFAAETGDLETKAGEKLARKGCDWIVANDVSAERGVFGGDHNEVMLFRRDTSVERWPRAGKDEVARRLALMIARALHADDEA